MEGLTQKEIAKLRRDLGITRAVCMITALLLILLFAGGGMVLYKMKDSVRSAVSLVQKVSDMDIESLTEMANKVSSSMESVDLEQIANTVEQIDVNALNEAVAGLDTVELSQTLANLNNAVASLQEVKESLSAITSVLGGR